MTILNRLYCAGLVVAVLAGVSLGAPKDEKTDRESSGKEPEKKLSKDENLADRLLRQKEEARGPTFVGKDPAFLVLPRITERSTMPRQLLTPQVVEMKEKALEFLVASQNASGAWSDPRYPGNTGVTALACLALMAEGSRPNIGRFGKEIMAAVDYLIKNADANGIIAGKGSNKYGPMYEHLYSTLALLLAYGEVPARPEVREIISRALQAINESQKLDGGWRYQYSSEGQSDMSVTATALWVLRTAKKSGFTVSGENIKRGVDYIANCALPDGTFRYRYWGIHASARLGGAAVISLCNQGDVDSILIPNAIKRIDYEYRRYTIDDLIKRRYFIYGCFYASLATYVSGDDYWVPWFKKVTKVFKAMQREDGEFTDEHENVVYPTALAAIVLQAPYGYLPIYER